MWKRLVVDTQPGPAAIALPRLGVGFVFFVSGMLKFLYENQGAGRFTKIGLPAPAATAMFVGTVEVVCGLLILFGLFTRLAAIPLVVDMLVAVITTKIPLLYSAGPEPVAAMPKEGIWAFAYQARLDLTMLLGCAFLVMVGAGAWSVDAWRAQRRAGAGLTGGVLPHARPT
jgi:putative oxidoreductase